MIGEQIIRQLTDKGCHAVNLKIKTIKDIAMDSVSISHNHVMSDALGAHFMYSILGKLEPNLTYFHEVEITPALSRGMYQTIKRLRLAGYTSSTLSSTFFVSAEKGADMIRILASFEQLLLESTIHDEAELYRQALGKYNSRGKLFILQSNLKVAYLQEEFLKDVVPKEYVHLPMELVKGVPTPEDSTFSKVVFGEDTPLSYLYNVEQSPTTVPTLSLFSAKTVDMELKEVLFQIKEKGLRFDEVAIFYTSSSQYVTVMYHLAERLDVPVAFGEGIPIGFTRPGKLVAGLITWMKDFYSAKAFVKLLQGNAIELDEDAPSKARWADLLRKANIGWDPKRYAVLLQAKIEEMEAELAEIESGESKLKAEKRIEEYSFLVKWFTSVFAHMPTKKQDGTFRYHELLHAVRYFLENYCKVTSGFDKAAKEGLVERIESLLPYADEVVTEAEGFQRIEEDFLSVRVGQSRPKPGYLHITTYKQGIFINRQQIFVVGLDNQRFPGNLGENPLLLDMERERIGRLLPLEKEKPKRDLYEMLQLLASSATREITVSYCRFDINENRTISPAYLFLQCYRIQSGDHSADFTTLREKIPSVDRNLLLEAKDWWIGKLTSSAKVQQDESILTHYSHIGRGLYAEKMRIDSSFTIFEGKIESDTTPFDPRKNPDITISAGKLEKIATCPYAYFLENVLRIRGIEEATYDPTKWLDAKTRGTLLHEIFEKFYKEVQARQVKPSYTEHIDLLLQIANESLEYVKTIVPSPNARTERIESEEIIESCETFLRIEEENSEKGEPLYFEYSFGKESPAVIELPSGTVQVRGIIDRVDQLPDGSYHIIDYKTGSSWGYKTKAFFKGGRQLQHLLYTLAIEAHLGIEEGSVKKSSYVFPTRKGAGKRFVREQVEATRTNGKDILDNLLSIIEHGHFTMTDDENDCKFCELKSICRRSTYDKDALKQKQQDPTAHGIKSFLGVRAYD